MEFKMRKSSYEGIPCWDRQTFTWGFLSPRRKRGDMEPSHVYKLLQVIDGSGKVDKDAMEIMLKHASSPDVYFVTTKEQQYAHNKIEL